MTSEIANDFVYSDNSSYLVFEGSGDPPSWGSYTTTSTTAGLFLGPDEQLRFQVFPQRKIRCDYCGCGVEEEGRVNCKHCGAPLRTDE